MIGSCVDHILIGIFHVRVSSEEKARELNTLLVVSPSNRIVSDILTWLNIARRFRINRMFRYPGSSIVCANHIKRCLHRFLNESHLLVVYWYIYVNIWSQRLTL